MITGLEVGLLTPISYQHRIESVLEFKHKEMYANRQFPKSFVWLKTLIGCLQGFLFFQFATQKNTACPEYESVSFLPFLPSPFCVTLS